MDLGEVGWRDVEFKCKNSFKLALNLFELFEIILSLLGSPL
jgi:hypothetical protein